jgi:hypothetical protein
MEKSGGCKNVTLIASVTILSVFNFKSMNTCRIFQNKDY